jgi:dCMP deaminase
MTKNLRPSIDEYFLKMTMVVAERSTCLRHHVGAILARDKHMLSTGYNGAPAGASDCLELGCLRDEAGVVSGTMHEICRAIHAEQNAIIQCALHGISPAGATLYCTLSPCILCAKMLVNSKIKRYVTFSRYSDTAFIPLFEAADIEFCRVTRPAMTILTKE